MAFLDFLEKTWKFLLGAAITILGGIMLFKKDRSAEIIEKSTESGVEALDEVIISNEVREEKIEKVESEHEAEIAKIRRIYEKKKDVLHERVRKKIELSLEHGRTVKATSYLAQSLNIKNLDKIDN